MTSIARIGGGKRIGRIWVEESERVDNLDISGFINRNYIALNKWVNAQRL